MSIWVKDIITQFVVTGNDDSSLDSAKYMTYGEGLIAVDSTVDATEEFLVPYIQQQLNPRNIDSFLVSFSYDTIIIV